MHRPMRRLTARLTCLLLAASLAGCGASSVNQLGSQSQFADGLDAVALSPGESAGEKTGRDAAAKDATKPRAAASASVAAKSENMTGGGHTSKVTVAKNSNVKEIAEQFTAKSKPGHAAYKIGALDVLEISVFKVDELSKTVQVADTGSISVPLLGEVEAAGRTAREVEQDLTKQWGAKYLNNPQVTVFIKEYNSKRITVEGSVKKPGVFPIQGHMSLLQSIAHAQGLEQTAESEVLVFRESHGVRKAARFDLTEIRNGNTADPALEAGDVVVVSSSVYKEMFGQFVRAIPVLSAFAAL